MAVNTRRSDMEIIRDILSMDRMGVTELRHAANLSYVQLQRYVAFLEQWDLIMSIRRGPKVRSFKVTTKGRRVLRLLDELFLLLESSDESGAGHRGANRAAL